MTDKTTTPNLPAIATRVVVERNNYEGIDYGLMVGVDEFVPAWHSIADGYGPQEWCRRITFIQNQH